MHPRRNLAARLAAISAPSGNPVPAITGWPIGALWGKERGLSRAYPLICHLLDAAAAVQAMADGGVLAVSQRDTLAAGFGLDTDAAVEVPRVLAAWHDLGKAVPGFQSGCAERFTALTGASKLPDGTMLIGHEDAGKRYVLDRLVAAGRTQDPVRSPTWLAQIVGGHHGVFPACPTGDVRRRVPLDTDAEAGGSDPQWVATRGAIWTEIQDVLAATSGHAAPSPQTLVSQLGAMDAPSAVIATGMVVLADWLASRDVFIEHMLQTVPPGHAWAPSRADLLAHYQRAYDRLLADLGTRLGLAASPMHTFDFGEQFDGFTPRGVQADLADALPALADDGPGLLVVMAPAGDGKTEAALHAASLMGRDRSDGVYMALPTMATTDAMLPRMVRFLDTVCGGASVTLSHSMAWLNENYQAMVLHGDDTTADAPGEELAATTAMYEDTCHTAPDEVRSTVSDWMVGSKRTVLAPNTVGTVDQVLSAALRGRHQPLRMLGLSRKVVVIDEAHAYDAYMQGLLRGTLRWLAAMRVPVILLSATLSQTIVEELTRAYASGAGVRPRWETPDPQVEYPGWLYLSGTTGQVTSRRVLTQSGRETTVQVSRRAYEHLPFHGSALADEVVRWADPVLNGGQGCLLVVCNTVTDAQNVYEALREARERTGQDIELDLLHARFPQWQRREITARVEARYGKDGNQRPRSGILVATQVCEQSLDLDFDALASDLAPIASLIQRAGRVHRHPRDSDVRGAWTAPSLTVLVPTAPDGDPVWRRDCPYDESLLEGTLTALARHQEARPDGIAIPSDVQGLVDAVYDSTWASSATAAEETLERIAARGEEEKKQAAKAKDLAIPAPAHVEDLVKLTSAADGDHVLGLMTRYEITNGRLVPVWSGPDGSLWLDQQRTVALPVVGAGRAGAFTRAQIKQVIDYSVNVPGYSWVSDLRGIQEELRPTSWARQRMFNDLLLLPMVVRTDYCSEWRQPSRLPRTILELTAELGLRVDKERA